MSVALEQARPGDLDEIAALMNRAYRQGEGWTTEAGYISGDRTRPSLLMAEMAAAPDGRLLVTRGDDRAIGGCVWVEPIGDGAWYLGSLTVEPARQNAGAGRRLLAAAEAWIETRGGVGVRITVVQLRTALIAWYERRGYRLTGEARPFPYHDARFGVPLRDDLHFVVLEKRLETFA